MFFALLLPIVFILFMSFGFTQDDYIEEKVGEIWTKTSGELYNDKMYLKALEENSDYTGRGDVTVFLAMARSRKDGGNIFNNESLHEIVDRMKVTENTKVNYNGNIYTWQDICARNNIGVDTTYEWPCIRLSAMDLFQESKWAFDGTKGRELYYEKVTGEVVTPRVQRMGSFQECIEEENNQFCGLAYKLRTNKTFAESMGKSPDYANKLLLLADIYNWEASHPCKVCIEKRYKVTIDSLELMYKDIFHILVNDETHRNTAISKAINPEIKGILENKLLLETLNKSITRATVEEFYKYYVERSLYATFGSETYMKGYNLLQSTAFSWMNEITEEDAMKALLNHADNDFYNLNIAGSAFPFWSQTGQRYFIGGSGVGDEGIGPLSGSGINLSGNIMRNYMDDKYNVTLVMNDPGFSWFIASVTPWNAQCGNEDLPGSNFGNPTLDGTIGYIVKTDLTKKWCVPGYSIGGNHTKQYFAKLWYDLLVDSENFLNIRQGESDPYTWTSGESCSYELTGKRFSFTNQKESDILKEASISLYALDEGVTIGEVPRNILLGNTDPAVGEYDAESNPLKRVGSIQTLYLASMPRGIVERVKNCKRPGGVLSITEADAEEVLYQFKINFENNWSRGWDSNAGLVEFVGLFDELGVTGSTGRLLKELTLSGTTLMAISFVVIFLFSAALLSSLDVVQSRVMLTAAGVMLVIISFFAALGLVILIGIKFNLTIGWTLPFLIVGLGVDSMYIVILALKNLGGGAKDAFVDTMKAVVVPITMTSLVNFSMFAIMNLSNIPAVYETAQAAMLCILFLWVAIVFCFPAYCYLDMLRQQNGRSDIIFCCKNDSYVSPTLTNTDNIVYKKFYYPLFLKKGILRVISCTLLSAVAVALLGIGIWGITEIDVGLGLEDLFPDDSSVGAWATYRTSDLAAWPVSINWGDVKYTDTDVQMKLVKQFEDVVNTTHVTDKDTRFLWLADFSTWTTQHCTSNFVKRDSNQPQCGYDFEFNVDDNISEGRCIGKWVPNKYNLRKKVIEVDSCGIGGYCLRYRDIHPVDKLGIDGSPQSNDEFCPVFEGWSESKLQFCVQKWRTYNEEKGGLLTEEGTATPFDNCSGEYNSDGVVVSPIPISSSPSLFGIDLYTHDDTLDMIRETRRFCDEDDDVRCWMSGIPFDYWEQYLDVFELLTTLSVATVAVGFGVSTLFLFVDIFFVSNHSLSKVVVGSISGGLLIGSMCALSITTVIGLSSLLKVNLTAFSVMSFVLSVGFVVEYAVHIVHRFLMAPSNLDSAVSRVEYAMSFLFIPTFMSFVSSTIGVFCLGFTKFEFNTVFFFRPLMIVMFITYFCGCYVLPVFLTFMDFNVLKLGDPMSNNDKDRNVEEEDEETAKIESNELEKN